MKSPASDALLHEYMARIPYFSVLDAPQIDGLARAAVHLIFSPDEVIFLEGDRSRGRWIIEDGNVKIT